MGVGFGTGSRAGGLEAEYVSGIRVKGWADFAERQVAENTEAL